MTDQSNSEIRNVVEAALLASEVPLSVRKIQNLFEDDARPETKEIKQAIEELETACEDRGIELCKIGKGYRFQTRERYAPWMRRLRETRPPRYSRALLETLSIIAYRQPVTRGDIESIRGVAVSSDIMRVLLDREWISQIGHRDVPGRPALYGTTSSFLEYFNLRGLSDLPALIEPRDLNEVAAELNITLPQESDVQGARDRDVIQAETNDADNDSAAPGVGDDTASVEDEATFDERLDERRDRAEAEIAASLEAIDAELATIAKPDNKVIDLIRGVPEEHDAEGADNAQTLTDNADAGDTESEDVKSDDADSSAVAVGGVIPDEAVAEALGGIDADYDDALDEVLPEPPVVITVGVAGDGDAPVDPATGEKNSEEAS